jgi:hypothetical protein
MSILRSEDQLAFGALLHPRGAAGQSEQLPFQPGLNHIVVMPVSGLARLPDRGHDPHAVQVIQSHDQSTVYQKFDEPNDCCGVEGAVVQLTDAKGQVIKLTTNKAGNFFLRERGNSIAFPYRRK